MNINQAQYFTEQSLQDNIGNIQKLCQKNLEFEIVSDFRLLKYFKWLYVLNTLM